MVQVSRNNEKSLSISVSQNCPLTGSSWCLRILTACSEEYIEQYTLQVGQYLVLTTDPNSNLDVWPLASGLIKTEVCFHS